jgi:deoxyuridine 5'-triphosphate nucleotidohydrolase
MLSVKRCLPDARLPIRATDGAAGYDLAAAEAKVVPAGGRALIATGLQMVIPTGWYGRIAPRSGLAVRFSITTGAGVIDSDYRGQVGVLLFNHGAEEVQISAGDRIAQIVFQPHGVFAVEEVDVFPTTDTVRGAAGFGSTGV